MGSCGSPVEMMGLDHAVRADAQNTVLKIPSKTIVDLVAECTDLLKVPATQSRRLQ